MKNDFGIKVVGIDLAKHIFAVHATDNYGNVLKKGKMTQAKLVKWLATLSPSLVGMEACGGANYFARVIEQLGHKVKLMAPNHVKPYIQGNKDDNKDAEGIAEAVTRPRMRFVIPKTPAQQQLQSWHRIRSAKLKQRIAESNGLRALAYEFGLVIPKGLKGLRKKMEEIIRGDLDDKIGWVREDIILLWNQFEQLQEIIFQYEAKIKIAFNNEEFCKRLETIPGIGYLTATAIFAAIGRNADRFKSSRDFAAWLGLAPRHVGSGGNIQMLGISKRGDRYIRCLLVHGGRSVVANAHKKKDSYSLWISRLKERAGTNKTSVAVAHKNARIIWSMLKNGGVYKAIVA